MKKNRFLLQRSSKADNRLVCTDTENKKQREKIGRMIKTEREKKGWSIYQLSKESGVQINHISRIEQGRQEHRRSAVHAQRYLSGGGYFEKQGDEFGLRFKV